MRVKTISLLILVFAITAFAFRKGRLFEIAKNLEIFSELYKKVSESYVDEVNANHLMKIAIDSMLLSLDPYTNYIPENLVENYRTRNTGQYAGIGAGTLRFGDRTVVTIVYPDFPAHKNGIKIGDEILMIDKVNMSDISMDEAERLIHGQLGTPVTLTIKRPGDESSLQVTLNRDKVKISNVPYWGMIDDRTGFVKLSEFMPDAAKEIKKALLELKSDGAENIILDLRDNPGGLVREAVEICNLFLPKGKLIVSTKGKWQESNVEYVTQNDPVDETIPVAILINRNSASASEIVSGTLQDYDRAIVVGEKSFGKGLVQAPRSLPYKSQVKITMATPPSAMLRANIRSLI